MTAICEYCLEKVPSENVIRDGAVYLKKECPVHGVSEHCIESDAGFYQYALQQEPNENVRQVFYQSITTTGIDVTRRCNVQCPHCYVEPDNGVPDAPISEIVDLAMSAKRAAGLILMGAEPTVRKDLPQLIQAIKARVQKTVGIYTNAIRLADLGFVESLRDAGLDFACVSLHTRDYLPNPILFDKKVEGIRNLMRCAVPIHHVSFSLRSLADLNAVLADCIALKGVTHQCRIRSPQKVGICQDEPIYLSEIYRCVCEMLAQTGHTVDTLLSDNNPYHVNLRVDGTLIIRLIRFPSLATADLEVLDTPPYALFDKEIGEQNLVLSFLMQEARRKHAQQTAPLTWRAMR